MDETSASLQLPEDFLTKCVQWIGPSAGCGDGEGSAPDSG